MVDIIWPLVCDNSRNFLGFQTVKKCQVLFLSEWMLRYTPLKTVLGPPKEIYVNQPSWLRGAISVKLQGVYGISYLAHTIHETGIFTYIYHTNTTWHGCWGMWNPLFCWPLLMPYTMVFTHSDQFLAAWGWSLPTYRILTSHSSNRPSLSRPVSKSARRVGMGLSKVSAF